MNDARPLAAWALALAFAIPLGLLLAWLAAAIRRSGGDRGWPLPARQAPPFGAQRTPPTPDAKARRDAIRSDSAGLAPPREPARRGDR
ncbi:MAG: hypothetical protein H6648_00795 [Caldilineae bacterium]|nr:hypothetical protein [Chloroflexota bacterium]MCB9175666.1 hypothetical protein [Caldilineae bacterium]